MAIAIVAAAAVSAASAYFGNQAASKQAEKTRQDTLSWQKRAEAAAQPFLQNSQTDYGVLANAMGVNGQQGMQSYLQNSMNPLLAGAQSNALDAMNQKYAAMGYGPLSGNQINSANNLMQSSYLGQYNTQVAQLAHAAQGQGAIGANMYGVSASALGPATQAGLMQGQYAGQAIAGAGQAASQGISALGGNPGAQSWFAGLGSSAATPQTAGAMRG
jgi:hypothetical protein